MSLAKAAAAGVRWNAASTAGMTALQTGTLVVLGRLLDPRDFGLLAIMVLVTGLAGIIASLGLSEALVQRAETNREQLSSLYWANVALGFIVYGAVWFGAPVVSELFGEPGLDPMLRTISLVFVINSWGSQFRALLQRELRFKTQASINLVAVAVASATSIVLAILGFGVWALIWGSISNAASATLLLALVAARSDWIPSLVFRLEPIKDYLSFGAYVLGSHVVNFFASRSDQLIIGTVLGAEPLGFYAMAFNLVVRPTTLVNPVITQVAFPVLAKVQGDTDRLKAGYLRMLRILTAVNGPVLFGFAAIAPIAIPLVLGEKWSTIAPLVQLLAAYALLRSIGNAGGSLVLAVGKARWSLFWNLGRAFAFPIFVYVGAQLGALIGVGWALVGVQLGLFLVFYGLFVRIHLGPCLPDYLISSGVPIAFAAAMALVVLGLVEVTRSAPRVAAVAGSVAVGAVVYFSLYWRFEREELIATTSLLFGRERQKQ